MIADGLHLMLAISNKNCRYKPEWMADLPLLAPMIASGMRWCVSRFGIRRVLKRILATVLISASRSRIALNLSTWMELIFFCNITERPFAHCCRIVLFLIDKLMRAKCRGLSVGTRCLLPWMILSYAQNDGLIWKMMSFLYSVSSDLSNVESWCSKV